MPLDHEKLPSAWGCGWKEGESRCAILSCRRSGPCEGKWADDIARIIGGVPRADAHPNCTKQIVDTH
jgi:hypothetical protein